MEEEISYPLLKKLYDGVNKVGDAVYKLNKRAEAAVGHIPEITASLLYVILHIVISYFHEPWYDEAVAWQIAKCASLKDIFLVLPHYEGHPPLWHLILLPFAKLGCPYEFSLSLVSLLFSGAAVGIIIWRSPFPRLVRLLLPFTYFLFYQYSILSRPYCVMMLAFVLAAVTFGDKDTKPWRFVLSLMLLCLSGAYGILMAGGITIAWLIGLLKKDGFRFLLDKRRTFSLLCLLALAILLMLEILPKEDSFALMCQKYNPAQNSLPVCLMYTFLVMPADACVTNVYSSGEISLLFTYLDDRLMISAAVIGVLILSAIIYTAYKKRTVLLFVIPYSFFAVFAAVKYMNLHHVGVALLFFIFWAWCTIEEKCPARKIKSEIAERLIASLMRSAGALAMAVSLFWGISASVHDISYVYDIGRNEAKFIKDNGLDNYRIMIGYDVFYEYDENDKYTGNIAEYDFNHCWSDGILAYFDRNIFFNFNGGRDDMTYTFHKTAGAEECADLIEQWREQGAPDVLVTPKDINAVYSGITSMGDYVPVYCSELCCVWKASGNKTEKFIYVRRELAEQLGLEEVSI